ncbi:MAG: phenylalanine--tRNA ligase subunit alpha, partial [Spirochaetales bacterium]|nr:phenylalanine--tRNA ligase subunit alpha [Spirochaetales bacterium]
MDIEVKNFHPLEVKLLRHVALGEDITAERIVNELDYKIGQCNQAFSWLCAKGCLKETGRKTIVTYELTELGQAQANEGTPAQRIFDLLKGGEPLSLPEIAEKLGLEKSDIGSAYGSLSKAGTCAMNAENKAFVKNDQLPADVTETAELLRKGLNGPVDEATMTEREKALMGRISKKRGAAGSPYKMNEREEVTYQMTELGEEAKQALLKANITGEEIGVLTPQIIASGSWKTASFRPYGLDAPVQRLIPGRHNPYANYIQWVK